MSQESVDVRASGQRRGRVVLSDSEDDLGSAGSRRSVVRGLLPAVQPGGTGPPGDVRGPAPPQQGSGGPPGQGDSGRHRHYVFTWNNYPADAQAQLESLPGVLYLAYQPEIGDNGTRHLQGLISFTNPRAFRAVAKLVRGWHVDKMRGTIQQAVDYCSKEASRDANAGFGFTEKGTRPLCAGTAGGRSDLAAVVEAIKAKVPLRELAEQFTEQYIHYNRGIERTIGLLSKPRDFKTEVYWYYGSTGSGKSRAASDEAPAAYWKNPVNKWWDGYQGESDVIIDDYRPDFCTFSTLLRLFDRYPMQVEAKGSSVQFVAKRIFITTPKNVEDTWSNRSEEDIAQLTRRITEVKHFAVLEAVDRT